MRKLYVLAFLLFFSLSMLADVVPVDRARVVAKNKYYEATGISQFQSKITDEITVKDGDVPLYYVFNFEKGFVIVSAEDSFYPIIGYSDRFTFKNEGQPDNVRYWMNIYAQEIKYVRENAVKAPGWDKWQVYDVDFQYFKPIKTGKSVAPLTGDILWDQGCGWNEFCPEDDDPEAACGHVWTGCVATAMGIIMYYWQYPLQGEGSHTYYAYPYGTLSANFGETNYMWELMEGTSPTTFAAKLLYHCGVAVEMNYSPSGSGAYSSDAIQAFKDYFRYSSNATLLSKSYYTDDVWKNYLKGQLDLARPVYYSGRDDDNYGHAFVCDGYDDQDYFHFNFGWGGYNNGYYSLTDVGGYHNSQQAGLYIYPEESYYPYSTNGASEINAQLDTFNLDQFTINLDWDEVSNAGTYKLFRDDELIAEISGKNVSYIDNDAPIGDHYYTVRTYFDDGSVALGNKAFVDATFRVGFYIFDPDGQNLRNADVTFNGQTKTAVFGSVGFDNTLFGWDYNYTVSHSDYATITNSIDVLYKDMNIKVFMGTPGDVESKSKSIVVVYPNPVTGEFYVSGIDGRAEVSIYNINGAVVKRITISGDSKINVTDLQPGVYNVQIKTAGRLINTKLVKN